MMERSETIILGILGTLDILGIILYLFPIISYRRHNEKTLENKNAG